MNKYRVRLRNGRVVGPFVVDQFKELLLKGHIEGNEDCQVYPVGDWEPLTKFKDLVEALDDTTVAQQEATFIRKLSDFDLTPKAPEPRTDNIKKSEPKEEDPNFREFKFNLEEPEPEIEEAPPIINTVENNPDKTRIVNRKQLVSQDEDKTLVRPDTKAYLEELKKQEEENKIQQEKEEAKRLEEEKNKIDLDNDSTQFFNILDVKDELKIGLKKVENELEEEGQKEKEKAEELEKKNKKKSEVPEGAAPVVKKKRKNIIIFLAAILLLAVLFPAEEKVEEKVQIVVKDPVIKFPQQYDAIDSEKAKIAYDKGITLYNTYKYDDLLQATTFFLESSERKFDDNPALAKLISTYSKLIPYSKTKIDDSNRIFKLVQVVSTKALTDPNMTAAVAEFYLNVGKANASVKVVEQFNAIKSNKPTIDLFGVYLSALIKSGNFTTARQVFTRLEDAPNKNWDVYRPMIDFHMLNSEYEKAANLILEAEKIYPDMLDLLVYKAQLLIYQEDFKSLAAALEKMMSLRCENNAFYYSKYYEFGAILAVATKNIEEAVALFKKALEMYESQELRSKLASLSQSTDPVANELIIESRALDFIAKAQKDMEEYKWRDAFKNALSATSIAPNFLTAKIFLAKLQTKRSFFKEAIDNLDEMYRTFPQNNAIVYALLDTYIEAYKFTDAQNLINIIASSEDLRGDPRFDATMAKYYSRQDNFNSTIMWLQRSINSNPLNDDIRFELANLFLRYRQYEKAKVVLNVCMDLDPAKVDYRIAYADILYETEGTGSAIGYLYDLLNNFPDNPKLLSAIGIYYFKSGQLKSFENIRERLSSLPNKDKSLYEFLIKSSTLEEKFDQVIEYSKRLLRIDPSDLAAEMFLGQVYMEKENFKEALLVFNNVQKRLDTYPKLKYYMSQLYLMTDNVEKAIELAQAEVKANPGVDEGYILLGDIYRKEENFVEAEKWYKEAQKIKANNPATMVGLAFVSFKKSQFDIAIDLFKKAIKINPSDKMSYKLLGDVYRQIGQSSEAIETYKIFLELSPESRYKSQIESYISTMQ